MKVTFIIRYSMAGENTIHNGRKALPANQREHAWHALLILLLLLGVMPQGPAPGGIAMAKEKTGAKASATVVTKENAELPKASETPEVTPDVSVAPEPEVSSIPEDQRPSIPENLEEIERQAESLLAGKKFGEVIEFIQENEAATAVSARMKQIHVEALIQTDNPNWLDVGKKAQELIELDASDPLGNLALGLSLANRKKPDTGKALECLSKAKNSKQAHPMASSAYWNVWVKKNLVYLAGLVCLAIAGGFLFLRRRKRRKQAADDLEKALAGMKAVESKEEMPATETGEIPAPVAKEEMNTAEPVAEPVAEPITEPVAEPLSEPVVEKEPVVPPVIDLVDAHIHAGNLAPDRPAHLPGREAEAVWQNLVRQATSRPIPLDVHEPAPPPPPPPPVIDASLAGDVALDLSEASATDELVTKLRMLAISDGELRKLLQMRNPEHLPALVEYITMKPDPVRLAFLAREMGHYHDPAVSEILSTLLYHQDHRVGLAAIQGLQLNGGAESVAAICPFLEAEVPALVEAARAALTEFGPRLVLEGLARLPSHPDERVRSAGVFVLSRMKGAAISKLLVAMLGDKSAAVRGKVLLGMAFQKNPAYLPVLREFVRQAAEEDRKLARKAIVFLQSLEKKPG